MPFQARPISFKPPRLKGLSARLIASHYENNYGGAVRRLNAIRAELAAADPAALPPFRLNGLKREELIATNSMLLLAVDYKRPEVVKLLIENKATPDEVRQQRSCKTSTRVC